MGHLNFDYKESFIKLNFDDIKNSIELASYEFNSKISDLLKSWDLVITCYWSDARFDKWNREESSIDLLICNKNELVSSSEVRDLLKEFISKSESIIFDNSSYEIWHDWEIYMVADEIKVGDYISRLAKDDYYIDVLNFSDELYKYENKTFPDRLIDAYNIYWDNKTLLSFKTKMLDDIIAQPKILKNFKNDVKSYFKDTTIKWENIRKRLNRHFDFENPTNIWVVRYDKESYFGFKHWPMRALQYKIIEKFISYVVEKKDSSIISDFPFSIEDRLMYFKKNKLIEWMTWEEYWKLRDLYIFFRELNEEIARMRISKKEIDWLKYIDEGNFFAVHWNRYIKTKKNLEDFLYIFNKM